jgi:aspartate/methionine/tyrosine aminotransferase
MPIVRRTANPSIYQPWEEYQSYCRVFWSFKARSDVLRKLSSRHIIDLSSGFNLYTPPPVLMTQLQRDSINPLFHFPYEAPAGQPFLIRAILAFETLRSKNAKLSARNIAVITGTTWAFDCIAQYLASRFPHSEVIIPVPNYAGFGLAMSRYGLDLVQVGALVGPGQMPTVSEIETVVGCKAKLLYVCPVNNPTGITISTDELNELIQLIQRYDLFLVWDETAASLEFPGTSLPNVWDVAFECGVENQVIAISGMSKDRSTPGSRIGWVISGEDFVDWIVKTNLETYAVPASLFTGFVAKDLLLRTLLKAATHGNATDDVYEEFMSIFLGNLGPSWPNQQRMECEFHEYLLKGLDQFLSSFKQKDTVVQESAKLKEWYDEFYYHVTRNLDIMLNKVGPDIDAISEMGAGYNIFVKLKCPKDIDHRNFVLSLFTEAGVEILPGPVFGLQPTDWQQDLDFWIRITLSNSHSLLCEGVDRLFQFKRHYEQESSQS